MARAAVTWTRDQLGEADLAWLENLPLRLELPDCAVSHGTWSHPERFAYASTPSDADESLDELALPVCFVGHTHMPAVMADRLGVLRVRPGHRYLINVGSVGQPRDGNPRLCVAYFDTASFAFTLVRLPYDVEGAAARILDAGLPPRLAHRLRAGR